MKNIRLLLVDDETGFRSAITRRLKKRGIIAQEAGSGQECLATLGNQNIDIVILDVKMPGMDGIKTLGHIKEKHHETEVILLTGHSSTSDGVDGIKSGAFDYLTKPVEFDHLFGKINQAYEKITRIKEKKKEAVYREKIEQQMIATERLASLGTLASGVAHEINNPLAIINESAGWMKLVLNKIELAEMPRKAEFEKALNKIETSIDRAKKITHQLLGVVRKRDSLLTEVNLEDLANEAIELVIREAINIDIEVKCKPENKNIWSDPYQLRQVLINLLTNAVQATGTGGKVSLIISLNNNDATIEVKDTGKGIPGENMKKIFEPFFSTKEPGEGTGLGLYVTRGIVDKLGGKIDVESRVGRGTSFFITLPKFHEPAKNIKNNGERLQ